MKKKVDASKCVLNVKSAVKAGPEIVIRKK